MLNSRWTLAIVFCLLLVLASGCGGGTYESRYETARTSVAKGSAYTQLEREPRSFEGANVTVRLPRSPSTDQKWTLYTADSPNPGDPNLKIERHVLRPPMLADQDSMSTLCEAWGKYETQGIPFELPVCAYLGIFDGKITPPKELEALISARFAEGHGPQTGLKTVGNWEEVIVKSPPAADGTQRDIPWRRLIATGENKLERKAQGAETDWKDFPVTYEAWMYAPPKAEAVVVIVWRVPEAVLSSDPKERGKFALSSLAPLTAGTLEIGGVAPAN